MRSVERMTVLPPFVSRPATPAAASSLPSGRPASRPKTPFPTAGSPPPRRGSPARLHGPDGPALAPPGPRRHERRHGRHAARRRVRLRLRPPGGSVRSRQHLAAEPSSKRPSRPSRPAAPSRCSSWAATAGRPSRRDQPRSTTTGNPVGGQRSDTIILVRVDPKTPGRDPVRSRGTCGCRSPARSTSTGSTPPSTPAPTSWSRPSRPDLGIPIDHYVEVNFDSFRQIVNAVGGVRSTSRPRPGTTTRC